VKTSEKPEALLRFDLENESVDHRSGRHGQGLPWHGRQYLRIIPVADDGLTLCLAMMRKQREQQDQRNWHADKVKQNRTHD